MMVTVIHSIVAKRYPSSLARESRVSKIVADGDGDDSEENELDGGVGAAVGLPLLDHAVQRRAQGPWHGSGRLDSKRQSLRAPPGVGYRLAAE
jgi:hypothetical protein